MPRTARAKVRRHVPAVPSALAPAPKAQVPVETELQQMDGAGPSGSGHHTHALESNNAVSEMTALSGVSKRPLSFKAALAQTAPHPYLKLSKSHLRREKRKARSHLAGGGLGDLTTALGDIEGASDGEAEERRIVTKAGAGKNKVVGPEKAKGKGNGGEKGKIGEGRGRTLGEKKRRDMIQDAAKRIPAVMAHPAYKQKPWATIREHVGNTLASK